MRFLYIVILFLSLGCSTQTLKEQANETVKLPLDGIWDGSFDINNRGPYDFHSIHVGGHSTAVSYKAKAMCSGNVEGKDGNYYAHYNLYALDGAPFDEAKITGILKDGEIESYFKTLNGGDIGKLTITYNPVYENNSSLELLEGKWSFTDRDGLIIDAEVVNGEITGNDSDSCKYSGAFSLIDPNFNAYNVVLRISKCHSVNGEYKGLAYLDKKDNVKVIRLDFVNALYGFHFDLQKVEESVALEKI